MYFVYTCVLRVQLYLYYQVTFVHGGQIVSPPFDLKPSASACSIYRIIVLDTSSISPHRPASPRGRTTRSVSY
jgi:hypothetical protein